MLTKTTIVALAVLLPHAVAPRAERIRIRAQPVPLDATEPARRTLGELDVGAVLVLTSTDERFDSISGFELAPGGASLVAVTDRGFWVILDLEHDAKGRLVDVPAATVLPMLGTRGEQLTLDGDRRDAEDIAFLGDGSILVAFEHAHRIVRYAPLHALGGAALEQLVLPSEARAAPRNGGIEALAVLPGDRVLALGEKPTAGGGHCRGWVMSRSGAVHVRFRYATAGGMQPTGATRLAGGEILLVERKFDAVRRRAAGRLAVFHEGAVAEGAAVRSRELARFGGRVVTDNLEAVAARSLPDGRTAIYAGSDDNVRNPGQRTLLLQLFRGARNPPPPRLRLRGAGFWPAGCLPGGTPPRTPRCGAAGAL